jgi:hypothetical protein
MAKPPQPPARKTMEVDISWLEDELKKDGKDGKASKAPKTAQRPSGKKPPRMPGAAVTVPPLPVAASEPPRRNTIDVQMEWVELVDENGNVVKKLTEKT